MATADPHRLFRHAEAFHEASLALAPEPDAPPEQLAPYIANSVFALELYLKCLLVCVKGKYPQVHSVQALFFDLPEEEIARVRRLHRQIYRAHFPPEPAGGRGRSGARGAAPALDGAADARLEGILAGAKDAFTLARYTYERDDAPDSVPDVTAVTGAVRGRILALHPTWPR